MKIKLGVIFGGNSVEHEVSVISAIQAMNSLDKDKYEIIPLYITKENEWYTGEYLKEVKNYRDINKLLSKSTNIVLYNKEDKVVIQKKNGLKSIIGSIDIAFPIVHGTSVEDGNLQGFLSFIKVPFVGPNTLGAAIGQDKIVMKQILNYENIPQVEFVWFYEFDYVDNERQILKNIKELGYPVVVKPASLGSSVGITVVKKEEEIKEAIEEALNYDIKILVEKLVPNLLEVNCSVYGNYEIQKASIIEEVLKTEEILSYKDKYLGNGTKASKGMASTGRIIPARISEELTNNIKEISTKAFKALSGSGVCRIDYLINSETGEYYLNEINTIPGSLSFYLWEPIDLRYKDLLNELIDIAVKNYKQSKKKIYSFDSNIFENFNGTKGSKGKLNN